MRGSGTGDQPRSRGGVVRRSAKIPEKIFVVVVAVGLSVVWGGYGGGGGGAYNAQSGTAAARRPRRRAERLPLSGDRAKAMARFLVCGTSGWKRWGGPGDNGGGAWVFVGLLCWPGGPPFEGSGSGEAEDGGQRIPPPFVRPQGLLGLSGPLITQTAHHSDSPITQTHSCSVIRLGGCFWAGPSWFGPYWVELSWVAQFWVDQRRSVYVRIDVVAQAFSPLRPGTGDQPRSPWAPWQQSVQSLEAELCLQGHARSTSPCDLLRLRPCTLY